MLKKNTHRQFLSAALFIMISTCSCPPVSAKKTGTARTMEDYCFSAGKISREVLENYLSRSITAGRLIVVGEPCRYRSSGQKGRPVPGEHEQSRLPAELRAGGNNKEDLGGNEVI